MAVTQYELVDNTDYIATFTHVSAADVTVEKLIDVSALTPIPTRLQIVRVWWACYGVASAKLFFDHATDLAIMDLNAATGSFGGGDLDMRELGRGHPWNVGGILDTTGDTPVGDIVLTTTGIAATLDYIDILIEARKHTLA